MRPIAQRRPTRVKADRHVESDDRAGIDRLVLVVRDSAANRLALRVAAADLSAAFPVPAREILAALGAGRPPEGSGLVAL